MVKQHVTSESVSDYLTPTNGAHGPHIHARYECVAESQSQGGLGELTYARLPARQIFFILPRRVVCASARRDASMAALVRVTSLNIYQYDLR